MTIPEGQTNKKTEVGNGAKLEFTFDFRIFEHAELTVYKVVTATQVQTLQVLNTDYTVEINGVDNALTTDGGKVIYSVAPLGTETSLILSNYKITQASDLELAGNLPEETLEDMSDKLTLIAIQLQEEIDRCLKQDEISSGGITFPAPVEDKGLKWSSGNLINTTNNIDDVATDAAASAAAALVSENNASTSESNASTSETNAGTSETNAAASAATAATNAAIAGVNRGSYTVNASAQAVIVSGFKFVGVATATQFTFTTNRTFDIQATSGNLGSLNTGSEASSTWYYLIALGDTTNTVSPHIIGVTVANYASFDETDLTGNYSGYDDYARIGAVYNNPSSDFNNGEYHNGVFFYADPSNRPVNITSGTFADVDFSAQVPPVGRKGQFIFDTGTAALTLETIYKDSVKTTGTQINMSTNSTTSVDILMDSSQVFQAKVSTGSADAHCVLYYDDLTDKGQ